MTPCPPIPVPRETYAAHVDDLFTRASQRAALRQYLDWLHQDHPLDRYDRS